MCQSFSSNIYSPTRYTMWSLWVSFNQHLSLARHVSDLTSPSSGAFCTSCVCRLWYVVIRVLFDTSSPYKVVGRTSMHITTYQSLQTQLLQNAPDDGPTRSETCRAKLKCWLKLTHWDHTVYLVGLYMYILQNDTRTLRCQVSLASTLPQAYAHLECYAVSLGNWFLTL